MKQKEYNSPKISINKVYTKKGDSGKTKIVSGHKFSKDHIRIKTFGEIDELNVLISSCSVIMHDLDEKNCFSKTIKELNKIQHHLFNLGNMVATLPEDYTETMPAVSTENVKFLESTIDYYNSNLNSLTSFVLPGGSELNVRLHLARTACRKCERLVVQLFKEEIKNNNNIAIAYLNRLSDLLFVLSRWSNHVLKIKEFLWNPNFNE